MNQYEPGLRQTGPETIHVKRRLKSKAKVVLPNFFILKCHFLILSKHHANLLNGGIRWAPKIADHKISTVTYLFQTRPQSIGKLGCQH